MASFGWKRKIGEKVSKATSQQFEAEAADEKDVAENDEGTWLHAIKRRKEILLEGCAEKSKQLKDEGANLAENKRSLLTCRLLRPSLSTPSEVAPPPSPSHQPFLTSGISPFMKLPYTLILLFLYCLSLFRRNVSPRPAGTLSAFCTPSAALRTICGIYQALNIY
uniref:Tetratricopeptide repeat domain 33 n=1 Tax=Equus caballus TaxID=9796 RepID=A0A9L0SN87_HORSE